MRFYLVLAAAGLGGACEQGYVYTPTTPNATSAGLPASRTEIPQEHPQGAVEVASFGITKLRTDEGALRALHVRMIVSNDGDDVAWQLDTSQQLVELPGEGESRAMFVNSNAQGLPIITIGRRQRQILDLYFPLPESASRTSRLPQFDLHWQVTTPTRVVASSTTFDRVTEAAVDEYAAGGYWWSGWGPYWWYDPFYPSVAFINVQPFYYHHGPVVISRFSGPYRGGRSYPIGPGHTVASGLRH